VVDEIIANHVTHLRLVTAHVKPAPFAALQHHMVNVVVLDHVVVAVQINRHIRRIENVIMCNPVADPVHIDRRLVRTLVPVVIVNPAVLHKVTARLQRDPVAAAHTDCAGADIVNIAT